MIGRTTHTFLPKIRLFAKPSFLQTRPSIRQQLKLSTASTATPITKNDDDDDDAPSVTLYQYQICPFCNKTKALLSYAGIRYETVEVNPLTKAELKQLPDDYRKVPIAKIDDLQINGSDEILRTLLRNESVARKLNDRWSSSPNTAPPTAPAMTMERFASDPSAEKWTAFASDDLAPVVYPNICRSLGESYAAFGYVGGVESFSGTQKVLIRGVGSLAMYFAASKIKAKRNIDDERLALDTILTRWESEALRSGSQTFSSGLAHPDVGDVAVFGTLYSIRGLQTHADAVENRGGVVRDWYERMEIEVGMD